MRVSDDQADLIAHGGAGTLAWDLAADLLDARARVKELEEIGGSAGWFSEQRARDLEAKNEGLVEEIERLKEQLDSETMHAGLADHALHLRQQGCFDERTARERAEQQRDHHRRMQEQYQRERDEAQKALVFIFDELYGDEQLKMPEWVRTQVDAARSESS